MACSLSCSISLVFIIGMIYFYNMTSQNKIVLDYKSKLTPELKNRYEKIVHERMMISYYGYFLGIVLSLIIIFYNVRSKKMRLNNISMVCIVMSTCFLTNYFYYILSPKSDWMLNHITDPKMVKSWLQMYRVMQFNYHLGLVLGILAVGVFAFAFRC
jgi:uncharacterized protein YacL